jgi:hypothetical protein
MWIKRNDHAPKSECAEIFNICPKGAALEKKIKFDHSLVFSCLQNLLPKEFSFNIYYNNIFMPWVRAFFKYNTFFTSPNAKHVGPCQWIM